MQYEDAHLSDEEPPLTADGELAPREVKRVSAHLAHCGACRARMSSIDTSIADLMFQP
ncbi:MAG: zf-HC2 domain-containing protein [Bryobacteraceae bacterium]|jgi:anti-sigma factor RsiW